MAWENAELRGTSSDRGLGRVEIQPGWKLTAPAEFGNKGRVYPKGQPRNLRRGMVPHRPVMRRSFPITTRNSRTQRDGQDFWVLKRSLSEFLSSVHFQSF